MKTVTIYNTQLPVVVLRGQRVVSTETLAEGYGTEATNIRTNLSAHKHRFVEGEHYFIISGEELSDLRVSNPDAQISSKVRSMAFYTERGASRMSKIVDTDEAWDFFGKLENAYFHPAQMQPKTQNEIIAAMALANVEQERRINHVESKVDEVAETVEKIKRGSIPAGWAGFSVLRVKCGMTDAKCRTLVKSYDIPTDTITIMTPEGQPRPMKIVLEADFMATFRGMMSEAEQRNTKWFHPNMGLFQVIGWEAK
ncbi:ORF6N domain-containing protein [Pantoea sp. PGP6]